MRVRNVDFARRLRGTLAVMVAIGAMCASDRRAAAGPKKRYRKPNILWIVWDTVRADHLSLYGYAKPTTPFLKKWGEESVTSKNRLTGLIKDVNSSAKKVDTKRQ